jgi:hypothetical protein
MTKIYSQTETLQYATITPTADQVMGQMLDYTHTIFDINGQKVELQHDWQARDMMIPRFVDFNEQSLVAKIVSDNCSPQITPEVCCGDLTYSISVNSPFID